MDSKKIKDLIPQRDPILMVDNLIEVSGDTAVTSFAVRSDNYFLDEDGLMVESGLIEHIAQSASAFAGYRAVSSGATAPPVGYIGEVKKFHCHKLPQVGDELLTTVSIGAEVAGVTIITGETRLLGKVVADTQMKIFIKPD
ncbi:MAG TPA: beta-hydroxyacyl-ACP dehydratase [Dysgonomonas sp.]|uniref:beta-hydroxyacyl-ACP dehydratase n=1 Tax=unclassified Dysgonomonas TaxID=2630389 RepID=UPI0025C4CEB4|nr:MULTISPECIES: beta-hydroxyacyl-ACP dehydratase [unclassified Dysgonomonas]HML65271.1 beta-hydroxyacyl-ACP dehydratase [Dysgonomonas sp.]